MTKITTSFETGEIIPNIFLSILTIMKRDARDQGPSANGNTRWRTLR
jgi:hypothetical protein